MIDEQGGKLTVSEEMTVIPTPGGGTTVHDSKTGVTATFGGHAPEYAPSGDKGTGAAPKEPGGGFGSPASFPEGPTVTVVDEQGGKLTVSEEMTVIPTPEGGLKVRDSKTGVTATFGGHEPEYAPSGDKGDKPASSDSNDSGDSSTQTSSSESGNTESDSNSDDSESSDSSGADDNGGGDSSADSGDGGDTDGDADSGDAEGGTDADKRGTGEGTGTADGPSGVVQGIVARARGEQRDPESGQPEECAPEGTGGAATQPGAGQGSCVPAGTRRIEPDDSSAPQAGESATATDRRGRTRASIGSRVGQPGLGGESLRGGDLPSLSPFDRNPVVNPGGTP
ncbi:MAG: hypothetical protein Kow006_15120 [Gammaproteobacteria bacterium]